MCYTGGMRGTKEPAGGTRFWTPVAVGIAGLVIGYTAVLALAGFPVVEAAAKCLGVSAAS